MFGSELKYLLILTAPIIKERDSDKYNLIFGVHLKLIRNDIQLYVAAFEERHSPDTRYASFDYCYNYFHPKSGNDLLKDREKSCLVLGFYLASWGMYRGSSFLLDKSAKHFEVLIEYIASLSSNAWNIDLNSYTDENIDLLIEIYRKIQAIIIPEKTSHLTLVTKIMLGIFGSVPAYDRFFKQTFSDIFSGECGFTSFNKKSLICLREFYENNNDVINEVSSTRMTIDFISASKTNNHYTKAKIVDMYGFMMALSKSKQTGSE